MVLGGIRRAFWPALSPLWLDSVLLSPLAALVLGLRRRPDPVDAQLLEQVRRYQAQELRPQARERAARRACQLARAGLAVRAPPRAAKARPEAATSGADHAPPALPAGLAWLTQRRHAGLTRASFAASRENKQTGVREVVLGVAIAGEREDWRRGRRGQAGPLVVVPQAELQLPAVVLGASGSGKTETLLRLAAEVRRAYDWQVIWLDAKGDRATAARFLATMRTSGVAEARLRFFPTQAYDGWRGDRRSLLNRLLAVERYSEPYYHALARQLLRLALATPPGMPVPRSSAALLPRLDLAVLAPAPTRLPASVTAQSAGHPSTDEANPVSRAASPAALAALSPREVAGVLTRYDGFFAALDGRLDGSWAYEDVDAAYLLLDGLALREEAASLGRYLLEDFAHYAVARKPRAQHTLLIVDEYSALSLAGEGANLVERLRAYGATVILSSQSYAGLGSDAARILDAAHLVLLHRCADPLPLLARIGTQPHIEPVWQTVGDQSTGYGSLRAQEVPKVAPSVAQQLAPGEVLALAAGRFERLQVSPQLVSEASLRTAEAWMANPPQPASAAHPRAPTAPQYTPSSTRIATSFQSAPRPTSSTHVTGTTGTVAAGQRPKAKPAKSTLQQHPSAGVPRRNGVRSAGNRRTPTTPRAPQPPAPGTLWSSDAHDTGETEDDPPAAL
jgi:hypothetical protein